MNTEQLIEIARECGTVIDVLCMGRHDNVVFTSGEVIRFANRIEQPYIDTIADLHDEIGRLREALRGLLHCPAIHDVYGDDKDEETHEAERIARKALEQTK